MTRLALAATMLAALMCLASDAVAGPITVTLSSPDNLDDLTVGETATIDLTLSGLAVNSDFIFNLHTSLLFPSANLQASGLTATYGAGSVFLYATQPTQFSSESSISPGVITGNFDNTASAPAISENGLYYSFTVTALAVGSGSISFNPATDANEYASDSTGFNFAPLPNGGPLSFTVTAVPEPAAFSMGLIASLAGLGCVWYRRRRTAA